MEFPSISVARQRTLHVLCLLSITLLQNSVNILSDAIGEMKGPFLYCSLFEILKFTAARQFLVA